MQAALREKINNKGSIQRSDEGARVASPNYDLLPALLAVAGYLFQLKLHQSKGELLTMSTTVEAPKGSMQINTTEDNRGIMQFIP